MTPEPKRALPRKPALKTVMMARPLAFARIWGGIILSGPKDCFGSMKDARILPVFLHSPIDCQEPSRAWQCDMATYSSLKRAEDC